MAASGRDFRFIADPDAIRLLPLPGYRKDCACNPLLTRTCSSL